MLQEKLYKKSSNTHIYQLKKQLIMKLKTILSGLLCIAVLSSCTDETDEFSAQINNNNKKSTAEITDSFSAQKTFAKVLSKAIYDNESLRQFIKDEAIKQFDNDFDVFYPLVKNKIIEGNKTFREILLSYISETVLKQIETEAPLLNIYVPDLSLFDNITAYNWNISDEEVPVAISMPDKSTALYLNGDSIESLAGIDIPDYHLLLVKNNERVHQVNSLTRNISDNEVMPGYEFTDDAFNSSKNEVIQTRATIEYPTVDNDYFSKDGLEDTIIKAWNIMKNVDPSLQRDYIYFGITPQKREGKLNRTVSEYLYRFQISPDAYYAISDQTNGNKNDPTIKTDIISNKISELSDDEVISKLWTDGNYEFEFHIFTGTKSDGNVSSQKLVYNIPPKELWTININKRKRHHTGFRHTKYYYSISPSSLGKKWYYPKEHAGKESKINNWDISQQSLEKTFYIVEKDEEITEKRTVQVKKKYTNNFKVDASGSFNPGGDVVGDIKVGLGYDSSSSTETTSTVEVDITQKSDELGTIEADFYSSIIIQETNKGYRLKDISNGTVTITLLPMSEAYTRSVKY